MSRPAAKTVTFDEGNTYTLDAYGFLDPPEYWNEEFAEGMARLQGIYDGLTDDHWEFISYIRKKFLDEKTTVLLSAESDLLKYLTRGSMLGEQPKAK